MQDAIRFYDEKLGQTIPIETREKIDALREKLTRVVVSSGGTAEIDLGAGRMFSAGLATVEPHNEPHPSGLNRQQRRARARRTEHVLGKHEQRVTETQ